MKTSAAVTMDFVAVSQSGCTPLPPAAQIAAPEPAASLILGRCTGLEPLVPVVE